MIPPGGMKPPNLMFSLSALCTEYVALTLRTPAPPLNCLLGHVIVLRVPASQSKPSAHCLVLAILCEQSPSLNGGFFVRFSVRVDETAKIGVARLIVSEDGAVIGVGILQMVFFGLLMID